MALPGFTAEDSVGPTVQSYRIIAPHNQVGAQHLSPQFLGLDDGMDEGDMGENNSGDDELNGSDTGHEV